jgi:predicted DNA-binding protein YlxM (UPF0122 family)
MEKLTMRQFLKNPSGKNSASFARRDLIIQNLQDRFSKLLQNRKKDFKALYIIDGSDYIFYFKIPSEEVEGIVYDVVLQFYPIDNENSNSLSDYGIKVFSNSINFLFTYAYIFNKQGLVIDFLRNKISSKALTSAPVIKNKEEIMGFEKSIYFSLLFMQACGLDKKSNIKPMNVRKQQIIQEVKSCEAKLNEYNKVKKELSDKKKREKKEKMLKNNEKAKNSRKKF